MRTQGYVRFVHRFLPSPFSIAAILTLLAFVMAFLFTPASPMEVLNHWQQGFWELLAFSMQMVLILVLGHALALTPLAGKVIHFITRYTTNSGSAAALVGFAALLMGFLNWGLCLIFGAILARKVGEKAKAEGIALNYPLVAAAGYSGMMIWHGGFSGSAPLVVAQEGHFLVGLIGRIPVSQTLLSPMNIVVSLLLLSFIPLLLYLLGRRTASTSIPDLAEQVTAQPGRPGLPGLPERLALTPAQQLDQGKLLALLLAGIFLFYAFYTGYTAFSSPGKNSLAFLDLNFINFCLLGLALLLHGSVHHFLAAAQEAVRGATGIIIQFPLYAGIMGVMQYSGLITDFSRLFVSISNAQTLPVFTLLSAGLVNVFVPSGGGQWAVQGPLISQAAQALGVPLHKAIMALAYGDGLTNMLQPFWALPLLAITRLDARDILPYSSLIMLIGGFIYILCLLLF